MATISIALICLAVATFVVNGDYETDCTTCNKAECRASEQLQCQHGEVNDRCDCCKICVKGPEEECGGPAETLGKCKDGYHCDKSEDAASDILEVNKKGKCKEGEGEKANDKKGNKGEKKDKSKEKVDEGDGTVAGAAGQPAEGGGISGGTGAEVARQSAEGGGTGAEAARQPAEGGGTGAEAARQPAEGGGTVAGAARQPAEGGGTVAGAAGQPAEAEKSPEGEDTE